MSRPIRIGDAIAAATSAVGVRPCGGCKRRQEALNRAFDPSVISWGSGSRAEPPAASARLAASLLVGACALSLRRRLR